MLFFILLLGSAKSFGQHVGILGELATSTNPELKNHRGIGFKYALFYHADKSWQVDLSKGYSSYFNRRGDIYYGNRIAFCTTLQKLVKGHNRQGFYAGGGIGFETYYGASTPSVHPNIMLQLQYLETNILGTPFSLFVAAKPKASVGLDYFLGCSDCFTPYSEPMLLLELNVGVMYNFSRKNKYRIDE